MNLPSFLQNVKASFADLDPSIAVTVNDETFTTASLDLLIRLHRGPATTRPPQVMQQLGYTIGWHLVARRAAQEGLVLSTDERYQLGRQQHALFRRYLEIVQPRPTDALSSAPITHNLASLHPEDRQALAQGGDCPAFQATVGSERVAATEVVEHILPHERWRLADGGHEADALLQRALKEVAEEKAALAAAGEEQPALLEALQRIEEQAIFNAYMREKRIGPPGAAMPPRPEDLSEVSEDEARAYYDSHRERFRRVARVEAQRIAVGEQKLAQELLTRAKKGEDFATLAHSHSTAPEATEGGSLGTLQRGKPGPLDPWTLHLILQHSQQHPEPSFFGPLRVGREGDWQIFALTRAEFEEVPFEGAQEPLRRRLIKQKLRRRGMTLLSELLASSTVVLNRRWIEEATGRRHDEKQLPKG